MKKLISIITLLIFGMAFGQNEPALKKEEFIVKATYWITDKCTDLSNRYENEICVREEINQFIIKNLNWSLEDNLATGDYEIRMYLKVDENGEISKVTAKSDYKELNNELERILMKFPNKIKLVDQNRNTYTNNLIIPLKFKVE